ncbi:MAG: UDP-N-acetylmuramate dehydrogenase, partial [Flavobacteriales bacterium]|nr:UDP-N-acetylmuramate dehydrogenase [Flavobacteriales bacterium]
KTILEETEEYVVVRFGAGEIWHETVMFAVNSGWGGLENLSLIPGSVGAAPIQNIGAYGVEIKDVLLQVNFIDLIGGEEKSLSNAECFFDYRNSIFKNELKNKVIVTSIDLKLNKNSTLKLDYGDIKSELSKQNIEKPTIKDVSQAVINIRQSKLPDPKELGNSGSFFKNPVIENELLQKIIQTNPEVKSYPIDENHSKLAAGWLIEQAGWKGKRVGNTGSHKNQALVLVNYGNATGKEIKNLAYTIIDSVERQFGVRLEPEVNII